MEETCFDFDFLGNPYLGFYITEVETAQALLSKLMEKDCVFGLDTETAAAPEFRSYPRAALSPQLANIRLLQVSDGETCSVAFDLLHLPLEMFSEFLNTKQFVAHNAMFDLKMLKYHTDCEVNLGCTMLAYLMLVQALYSEDEVGERPKATLEAVAEQVLGVKLKKLLGASDWSIPNLTFEQVKYAVIDAMSVVKIAEKLAKGLEKNGLTRYYKLVKQAQHPIAEIELNGIYLDKELHMQHVIEWKADLMRAKQEVMELTGLSNITDHTMSAWLTSTLDPNTLALWPRTDTGKLKTDTHAFSDFSYLDIVKPFAEYKKKLTLCSTFGSNLLQFINPASHRIHSNYFICGARTGRLSSGKPNCFSADTEILTTKGWVSFPNLTKKHSVAQWEDGVVTFTKPLKVIKQKYSGYMLRFSNQHIDLKVTPDHRCLLQHRKNLNFRVFSALGYPSDYRQLNSGRYGVTVPISIAPSFIQLLVAIQADGSWHDNGIDFCFRKRRKYLRLLQILRTLKAPFSVHTPTEAKPYRIRVLKSQIVKKARDFLGEKKEFGDWLLKFNYSQLELFCNELFYWDGLFRRKSNYSSSIKTNTNWAQIALILTNHRANFRRYRYHRGTGVSYQLDVTRRNYSLTTNVKRTKSFVKSTSVYCVTVPSGFIVVRRNGKTMITGNCQNMPRDISVRSSFMAEEGNVIVCADYSQIELRCAAELSKDVTMLKAFREGIDMHRLTASRVANKPIEEVTSEERQFGKCLGFGLLFGLGAKKFSHYAKKSYGVEVTEKEAFEAVETFRETYAGYREWQLQQANNAEMTKRCTTPMGKLRRLPDESTFGNSMNHPVQGGAAEVMLSALYELSEVLKDYPQIKIIGTVHDEILLECPEEDKFIAGKLLEQAMYVGYLKVFPNGITRDLVEAGAGKSWADAKAKENKLQL